MSLFDPLDHKVLLPEMEEIEGEPIICQTLFGPLGLPEWLSIFLGNFYQRCVSLTEIPMSGAFSSVRNKISRSGDPAHPKLKIILTLPTISLLKS